jgi:hypothetical protein
MDRNRAAERAKALDVLLGALAPLLGEDRAIVIEDALFRLDQDAAAPVTVPPNAIFVSHNSFHAPGVSTALLAVERAANATALPLQQLQTRKAERRRRALLAMRKREPAPLDWLCVEVYGKDSKPNRLALATLLQNMIKKALVARGPDNTYVLTSYGSAIANMLQHKMDRQKEAAHSPK